MKIVISVIFVVRAQRFFNTFDRKKSVGTSTTPKLHFPLWKLIQNVGSFTIFNLFYVLFCIFLLWNPYKCLWQQNQAFFHRMLGIIRITLLLRLIFDPVLSFFVDKPVGKIKFCPAFKRFFSCFLPINLRLSNETFYKHSDFYVS